MVLVANVFSDVADSHFISGVEVTHWNGVAIGRFIEGLSWQMDGANPFARIAMAIRSMTVRPLAYMLPPEEDWVTITYISDGVYRNLAVPWRVYVPSQGSLVHATTSTEGGAVASLQGVDDNLRRTNGVFGDLLAPNRGGPAPIDNPLPNNLQFREVQTASGAFGYIRIFSFDTPDSRVLFAASRVFFSDFLRPASFSMCAETREGRFRQERVSLSCSPKNRSKQPQSLSETPIQFADSFSR